MRKARRFIVEPKISHPSQHKSASYKRQYGLRHAIDNVESAKHV